MLNSTVSKITVIDNKSTDHSPDTLKKLNGIWKVKSVSSGTLSLIIPMDSAIYNKKLIFETI